MAGKRRSRRPSSDGSEELGLDGTKKPARPPPSPEDEGSEEEERDTEAPEEEADESGGARSARHGPSAAAPKPKETPKRTKKPSLPPPPPPPPPSPEEDVETQGSGNASPARDVPHDELEADAPPPRNKLKTTKRAKRPLPPSQEDSAQDEVVESSGRACTRREIVASPDHNRDASPPAPERTKSRAKLPQEVEEQAAAGPDGDGIRKTRCKTAMADKDKRRKKKKKKLQKVLAKPSQPQSTELGLTGNREEVPEAGNTSLSQQKDGTQEDDDTGVEVSGGDLPERNASLPKLCTSEGEKKPPVERSWSPDDELNILTALVEHAQSHEGALPDSSDLMANLTFDKTDANADKLDDKIRKLRARYRRLRLQGCPTNDFGRRLFELSDILWGKVDDHVRVEATIVTRDFKQLSTLYPYLAKEIKVYAETHPSGDLVMEAATTIGDEKARHLNAMCKKQRVDTLDLEEMRAKLELSQAKLTMALLSALSSLIN